MERVTSFKEHFAEDSAPWKLCIPRNAGCFGRGSSTISQRSIERTVHVSGLSVANSCTHNRPTFAYLTTSSSINPASHIAGSAKFAIFPSFHSFQACSYHDQKYQIMKTRKKGELVEIRTSYKSSKEHLLIFIVKTGVLLPAHNLQ